MRGHVSSLHCLAAGALSLALPHILPTDCWAAPGAAENHLAAAPAASRSAQAFYVGGDNCSDAGSGTSSEPWCTLERAFETDFVSGDVVMVRPGEYLFAKALTLPAGISLLSTDGKSNTVLRVEALASCRHFDLVGSDTTTRIGGQDAGFTFTGGRSDGGGGALSVTNATLTSHIIVEGCDFVDNRAVGIDAGGGAIYCGPETFHQIDPFTLSLIDCEFRDNRAGDNGDGGAVCFAIDSANPAPVLLIEGCVFERNETAFRGSQTFGGALYINSCHPGSIIRGCTFEGNRVTLGSIAPDPNLAIGGAVYLRDSKLALADCTFIGNEAPRAGAVYMINGQIPAPDDVRRCVFIGNRATVDRAGALYLDHLNYDVIDCVFEGNSAAQEGGAIWALDGVRRFEKCEFTGNWANSGGAIFYHHHELTMVGCTLVDNTALNVGGALAAGYTGRVNQPIYEHRIEECTFVNNDADAEGGAIYFLDNGPADGSGFTKAAVYRCLIVDGNGGAAHWDGGPNQEVLVDCTNSFRNGPNDYGNEIICGDACIFDDPLFCDPVQGDYGILPGSPCAPANSPCGELIGSIGVGCEVSAAPVGLRDSSAGLQILWVRPEGGALSYRIESDLTSEGVLEIVDIQGRRVTTVAVQVRQGARTSSWDPSAEGHRLPSGIYLLKATSPSGTASAKFAWLE